MKGTHRRRLFLAVGFALGLSTLCLGGCSFLPTEDEILQPPLMKPQTIEYRTEEVVRGDLFQELNLSGAFSSTSQKSLSFEAQGGRLKTIRVTAGQEVATGELIAELDSQSLASQVRIQEIEVEKSRLTLSQLKSTGSDSFSIRRAELDLEQQRIRLADMDSQLAATRIFSPIDGRVVYVISTPVGESVAAYQRIALIADVHGLILQTTSSRAAELPIGAKVTVTYKSQDLIGEVVANPTTLSADPDETMRGSAIIRIEGDLPAEVELGDDARISYTLEKRENVIVVSRSWINSMSGRYFVNVLEDGVRVEKDVELGLVTDTEAEIVKGLTAGEQVIIG
jgi:multidrug efflux pump subunit AcrA (membrane-fusion protein)